MARKSDLVRVDRRFADELRKTSKATGESMIDITAGIKIGKEKRRSNDPFDLTVG